MDTIDLHDDKNCVNVVLVAVWCRGSVSVTPSVPVWKEASHTLRLAVIWRATIFKIPAGSFSTELKDVPCGEKDYCITICTLSFHLQKNDEIRYTFTDKIKECRHVAI